MLDLTVTFVVFVVSCLCLSLCFMFVMLVCVYCFCLAILCVVFVRLFDTNCLFFLRGECLFGFAVAMLLCCCDLCWYVASVLDITVKLVVFVCVMYFNFVRAVCSFFVVHSFYVGLCCCCCLSCVMFV